MYLKILTLSLFTTVALEDLYHRRVVRVLYLSLFFVSLGLLSSLHHITALFLGGLFVGVLTAVDIVRPADFFIFIAYSILVNDPIFITIGALVVTYVNVIRRGMPVGTLLFILLLIRVGFGWLV